MVSTVSDLLQPYINSYTSDEDEDVVKQVFIKVFTELYGDRIKDILDYGMPQFLSSQNVVERFTKQDGLAVIRRPASSDIIMRIIYANWNALGSKRGLAFLEFVLQMLWPNKWKIFRVYHSISRVAQYPALATIARTSDSDSFLTHRIMILMTPDVDNTEIAELTPTLQRLVPARVVPVVGVNVSIEPFTIGAAAALSTLTVGIYQYQ